MPKLSPGSYFKIGNQGFEYVGLTNQSGTKRIVGRLNPDTPQSEGAIHKVFSQEEVQDQGTKEGPFNKDYSYSEYIKEKNTWQSTFGSEIEVPYPPQILVDTLKRAKEAGLTSFEAHYIPEGKLSEEGIEINGKMYSYPDFWIPIRKDIFAKNNEYSNFAKLPGKWILVDGYKLPKSGDQGWPDDDPLKPILLEIDSVLKKTKFFHSPGSRNVSFEKLRNVFFPYLAVKLGLEKSYIEEYGAISVPPFAIYNVFANIFHPDWNNESMTELAQDDWVSKNGQQVYVTGGSLFDIVLDVPKDSENSGTGFRPLIQFPENNL